MDGHPRTVNRRTLISLLVATGALCAVWLLPSAYGDGEHGAGTGGVIPVEQPQAGLDQDQ
ncbi:hypothetical protein [Streptomyces sp. NBC_01803]|uniref:hypothetical protein n=1 Tax=Streptomyces sp. NBC_01803 TaxID=2975946 RepID=UPI002DD98062|nr:hypothetical protein [Streptomyces sp. NBC_01803]WSA45920.1 hypothetical protein OIE51_17960 [Streptomyces sp. NBC_01803]